MSDRDVAAVAPSRLALSVVRHGRGFARVAATRALVGRSRSHTDPAAGRFTRRDVAGFVADAFGRFEDKIPGLPSEPTVGSRQNVMLAALTLSLLESLEQAGVERSYAIELTGDTCWRFYRHWGRVTKTVTGLVSRDPVRRLRLSVDAFLTYPFARPGYRWNDVAEADGRSLNMLHCPVADYLGQAGAADLCTESWCNLDYALAEMWGARLQRSATLATGASSCDFRFRTVAVSDDRSQKRQSRVAVSDRPVATREPSTPDDRPTMLVSSVKSQKGNQQ